MKVLLVNGSPHKDGCTYTALCEVSEALNEQGIDTARTGRRIICRRRCCYGMAFGKIKKMYE